MAAGGVPELGPALGRLTAPGGDGLAATRLALVTGTFEAGAAARAGDRATLAAAAWRRRWEEAVAAAAGVVVAEADAGLTAAALESRMPERLRAAVVLTPAERRGVAARLGSEGVHFLRALDGLGDPGAADWEERILGVARTLEAAWLALESAAARERQRWAAEADRVRRWRRSRWPVIAMIAALVLLAGWLGLALGGWVPAGPLTPVRDWLMALP
jgi:hypothetical protein